MHMQGIDKSTQLCLQAVDLIGLSYVRPLPITHPVMDIFNMDSLIMIGNRSTRHRRNGKLEACKLSQAAVWMRDELIS